MEDMNKQHKVLKEHVLDKYNTMVTRLLLKQNEMEKAIHNNFTQIIKDIQWRIHVWSNRVRKGESDIREGIINANRDIKNHQADKTNSYKNIKKR